MILIEQSCLVQLNREISERDSNKNKQTKMPCYTTVIPGDWIEGVRNIMHVTRATPFKGLTLEAAHLVA